MKVKEVDQQTMFACTIMYYTFEISMRSNKNVNKGSILIRKINNKCTKVIKKSSRWFSKSCWLTSDFPNLCLSCTNEIGKSNQIKIHSANECLKGSKSHKHFKAV